MRAKPRTPLAGPARYIARVSLSFHHSSKTEKTKTEQNKRECKTKLTLYSLFKHRSLPLQQMPLSSTNEKKCLQLQPDGDGRDSLAQLDTGLSLRKEKPNTKNGKNAIIFVTWHPLAHAEPQEGPTL